MNRRLGLPFALALFSAIGCGSSTDSENPAAPSGSSAISSVTPRVGLLDREVDVIVSGDDTRFDSSTTVDFGAGVSVVKLTVARPTH